MNCLLDKMSKLKSLYEDEITTIENKQKALSKEKLAYLAKVDEINKLISKAERQAYSIAFSKN